MSFIIEDGSGIPSANAYASTAYMLNYLTERNRQAQNLWEDLTLPVQQAHGIAATDYIEGRFRLRFMGQKQFRSITRAKAVLTFVDNPIAASVVVLGTQTYTFVAALGVADDVLLGANAQGSMNNLINAIAALPDQAGVTHGTGTVANVDASGSAFEDNALVAEALVDGTPGNLIVSTTDVVNGTWSSATLIGGTSVGKPQPLSFPKINLFDRDGLQVLGMPDRLLQATTEYAVRNAGAILQPDPDVTTGLQVVEKKEKVDVIEEITKWTEGGAIQISIPYPAADSLLCEYLRPSGLVFRS
jgi:hypothetical protein